VSSSTSSTDSDSLDAGHVGRPHGLDGSFHVTRPRAELLQEGAFVTVAGERREIVRRAGTDARPVLRLAGCEGREAAEALRGQPLLVARAEAPALGPDEWWPEELEGCRVRDGSAEVGVVAAVRALPSCEVLEVARAGGGELLVPLVRDAVRSVDVSAGEIDVDLAFVEGEG
jgi:16S rRNA processing protein RimM